ncbi:MAG TPA: hypothetical protein VLX90_13220, partial [Steroidobacteraceae bacterium]|nr:hypothetical protein [Steroidobacteraceae bacterium]
MTSVDFGTFEIVRPAHEVLLDLAPYTLEQLRSDREFVLYRGHPSRPSEASRGSFLLLSPIAEHPSRSTLRCMEHEYSFRAEFDPA